MNGPAWSLADALSFATRPLTLAEYEDHACSLGMRSIEDPLEPRYRLLMGEGFAVMLLEGELARIPVAGLFEDEPASVDETMGIEVVPRRDTLRAIYLRVRGRIAVLLGEPLEQADDWAMWQHGDMRVFVLRGLGGDGHVGESATVDVRIAPIDCPPSVLRQPFAYPTA